MGDLLTYRYGSGTKEFVPIAKNVSAQHNSIYRGAELPYTWAEIKTKITNGDFSDLYIGDYKIITLTTEETVYCEIAGICNYQTWGNSGIPKHIDFISRHCLATAYQFNTTDTNNGTQQETRPWSSSSLFNTLNVTGGVIDTLPNDLSSVIISKQAYLEARYSSGGAISSDTGAMWAAVGIGKLWIPAEIEVFGHATWSDVGYGTAGFMQYPIFRLSPSRIVKTAGQGGSRCDWWELSAYRENASYFCSVGSSGAAARNVASSTSIRVPLCFRIG